MSHDAVKAILSNPVEVIGSGARNPFKRKVNGFWPMGLALAAVLFSANAAAHGPEHEPPVASPEVAAQVVDMAAVTVTPEPEDHPRFQLYYQKLGAFVSQPGEPKERFMARVGTFLAYYTKTTGWEACGMVQQTEDGQGWAVRLITNGSQIGCAQIQFETPGYVNTDEGIHSHPAKNSVRVSLQDQRLRGGFGCGTHIRVSPYTFSTQDYHVGPGYLVVPAGFAASPKLLFQNGRGTEETIASLDERQIPSPDSGAYGAPVEQKNAQLVAMTNVVKEEVTVGVRTCKTF